MKKVMVVLFALLCATGCTAQHAGGRSERKPADAAADTSKPTVNWKVNKEYDSNGNLIRYDSTYSWSYNGSGDAMKGLKADSVLQSLRMRFGDGFPVFFSDSSDEIGWHQGGFFQDFFSSGFRGFNLDEQLRDMKTMMNSMDSLNNAFLKWRAPEHEASPELHFTD
jgi:hypothetical protein